MCRRKLATELKELKDAAAAEAEAEIKREEGRKRREVLPTVLCMQACVRASMCKRQPCTSQLTIRPVNSSRVLLVLSRALSGHEKLSSCVVPPPSYC